MDARNVLVVVTRWYGGIHLGPDRFKHINNCTRDLLEAHGYVRDKVVHCLIMSLIKTLVKLVLLVRVNF